MFIVDVQGFQYGEYTFLCKEISILNTINGNHQHSFIKMPINLRMCDFKTKNLINWSTNHLHGLEFNLENYCLNYEEISSFLTKFITANRTEDDIVVAVKGIEKRKWLNRLLAGYDVIDLNNMEYPTFEHLKTIFKSFHCNKHLLNNLNCTLENVFNLYNWCKYCVKDQ